MRAMLDGRIHKDDISGLCSLMQGTENGRMKEMLYGLALDDDARVAANALWVLTHFPKADNEWLDSKRDGLTDRAMVVEDATGRRLLLTLLNRLEFTKDGIRADFLDFCLSRLTLASESPGVRSLCMNWLTACAAIIRNCSMSCVPLST